MKKICAVAIVVAAALAAPAFAQPVDRDAWMKVETRQKLKPGMTHAQVETVIGKPQRARVLRQVGARAHDYEYRTRDGKNWLVTSFVEGRLSHYSVARLVNPKRGQYENCQRHEAWSKVDGNMKPEEVVEILGEPTSKAFTGGMMAEMLSGYMYEFSDDPNEGSGIVMFGPAGVVGVMEPFCPPAE